MMHPQSRPGACLTSGVALALALVLAACAGDAPSGGDAAAPVTVRAALAGTVVTRLAVQVTGPAIRAPIVASVDVTADVPMATLTLDVPVGGQRTFLARGYDTEGNLTHEGMTTATVRPSGNAPVAVRLYARTGDVPVTIGVGEYVVAIAPGQVGDLVAGETTRLAATVRRATGETVPGAVVTWGSLNPGVAAVDATGLVTTRAAGTTTIHASYQGAAVAIEVPVRALVLRDIGVGAQFACALDDTGVAWCWGWRAQGRLGDGLTDPQSMRPRPGRVAGGQRFAALAVAWGHACALTPDGEGWCWGDNTSGATGVGDAVAEVPVPRPVAGGLRWRSLHLATAASCGLLLSNSQAYCWGSGVAGALGLTPSGGSTAVPTPAPVTTHGGPWASLQLSPLVSCALASDGAATCAAQATAAPLATAAEGYAWRTLQPSGTSAYACGLTTAREIRCWGQSNYGQTGTGAPLAQPLLQATPVAGAQGWDTLSVAREHACALRGGTAYCWGYDAAGRLGHGTPETRHAPTAVAGDHVFTRIATGPYSTCALRADGAAFCWGFNGSGMLGDGTFEGRAVPTRVLGPAPSP